MKKLLWLLVMPLPALAVVPSATLTWGAPTKYDDGTTIMVPLTYTVYQGLKGTTKVVAMSGVTATSATIAAGLQSGTTVCWELTATAGGQESVRTAEACKTFPEAVPLAPSALTVR